MKTLVLIVTFLTAVVSVGCKVRVELKNLSELQIKSKALLKDDTVTSYAKPTVYVTLIEASSDVYKTCESICREKKEETYYAEVTDFSNYGKIFRCQCGDKFTPWYSLHDLSQMDSNILMGDLMFNSYLSMPGYDLSDCDCDDLKRLLARLLN